MRLKKKLRKGELSIGSWITLEDCSIAEIMSKSEFDWIVVDMEHSAIGIREAHNLIRVIELEGCVPLVRVGENSPYQIKRVMDAGAHGVVVPMVNTAEDALKAVEAVKYPPVGKRGVGLARAQGYGEKFEEYKKWVQSESIVVVQIEHIDAINNLEDILKVEGVDGSIIGPYDLSASLGYPGDFERKEMKDSVTKYLDVCKKLAKPAGIHSVPSDAKALNEKIQEGFKFIAFSFDAMFIGDKIRQEMKEVNR